MATLATSTLRMEEEGWTCNGWPDGQGGIEWEEDSW